MSVSLFLLIAAGAYLLGSVPFGYLLVRVFRSEDIRKSGSGNIGATNVVRSGAKGLGVATLLLDMLKGFLAVGFAREVVSAWAGRAPGASGSLAGPLDIAAAVAAVAAVLGHVFPIWLRFKGGKGVATAFGVLLQLVPLAALAGVLVFLAVVFASRYVSLASIASAAAIPAVALLLPFAMHGLHGGPAQAQPGRVLGGLWERPWLLGAVLLIPTLVIAKHHANLRRLLNGTEYRFGRSVKASKAVRPV